MAQGKATTKRAGLSFRKILAGLVVLAIVLVIAAWAFRPQIGERLFDNAVEQGIGRDVLANLPDGLHVALCGSGSPLPDPTRAGPCSAVIAGDKIFIVDVGDGAARNIGRMGLAMTNVEAVLLTHFHSDHIDGLGAQMFNRWTAGGQASPVPVIGGEGVEQIVEGFNAAYAQDVEYRVAHHGADIMVRAGAGGVGQPVTFEEGQENVIVYDKGGVKITAFRVNHEPVTPALGYRFDYKDRSIVFSGDTAKAKSVETACNGCDILVHEVLNTEMVGKMEAAVKKSGNKRLGKILYDIPSYHTSPIEVAETAKAGTAKMLVFSHIVPLMPLDYLEGYFLKGVSDAYDGPVVVGKDGMIFSLPANKNTIIEDDLL